MTTYLSKQKKTDLQAMADKAGVPHDNLLKEDLVAKLDEHLRANSSKFADDKLFAEYFERSGSPIKKGRPSASGEEKEKAPRRRTIAPKPEPGSPEATSSALVQASPIQAIASRIRLPASPAVHNAINAPTTWAKRQYNTAVKKSGIKKNFPLIRQEWSRVETIQLLTLIFEALGLREVTFPFHWQVIPGYKSAGIPQTGSYTPDLRLLATSSFWAPTLLWFLTSFALPLIVGYFFNLTYTNPRPKNRKVAPLREVDPLIFSITKGLLAYLIYSPHSSFVFWGLFDKSAAAAVQDGIWGGYATLLIGSGVGILTSLYDILSYKS